MSSTAPQRKILQLRAVGFFASAGLLALIVHYTFIAAYLLPHNAIKFSAWEAIHSYVDPVFTQAWTLFAPTPPQRNDMLLLRAAWQDPARGTQLSAWVDVTSRSIAVLHRDRISPMGKLVRPQTGLLENIMFEDKALATMRTRMADSLRSTGRAADSVRAASLDTVLTAQERAIRGRAREAMARLASAYAMHVFHDVRPDSIEIRIAHHFFPRFSQHALPDSTGRVELVDLGWERLRTDVALP